MPPVVFTIAYGIVALIVTGLIASEGVDKDGNVYDDTAVTWGFTLGLLWPITIIAFGLEKLVVNLGKAFN